MRRAVRSEPVHPTIDDVPVVGRHEHRSSPVLLDDGDWCARSDQLGVTSLCLDMPRFMSTYRAIQHLRPVQKRRGGSPSCTPGHPFTLGGSNRSCPSRRPYRTSCNGSSIGKLNNLPVPTMSSTGDWVRQPRFSAAQNAASAKGRSRVWQCHSSVERNRRVEAEPEYRK